MTEIERLNEVLKFAFLKIGIYKKADMADFLGYKSPYFSGIINGKEKMSDLFLKNISEKLNINIDYILDGKGQMLKDCKPHINLSTNEAVVDYNEIIQSQQRTIETLTQTIASQQRMIEDMYSKKGTADIV